MTIMVFEALMLRESSVMPSVNDNQDFSCFDVKKKFYVAYMKGGQSE